MNAPNNANATSPANHANANATNPANAGHDAATYRGQIARLLDVLTMEVEARGDADQLHAVREHLVTSIVRLSNMSYAEVYRFLLDAE